MENTTQEQKTSDLCLQEFHDKCFDGRKIWETYLGQESEFHDDTIGQLFSCLIKIFSSGRVKGHTLMHLTVPPHIHFNFPACAYFEEIIVGTSTDNCVQEVEMWWKNTPGAFDMSHLAEFICECEGDRERWSEKQTMLRSKMKRLLKFNITQSNPVSPVVLPPVDCLLLTHSIELLTLNKGSFCRALKNVLSLLKTGGQLIMVVDMETTFYMDGNIKFPHLSVDERFLEGSLIDIGCCIEELHVLPRKATHVFDVCDYTALIVINARKETEC